MQELPEGIVVQDPVHSSSNLCYNGTLLQQLSLSWHSCYWQ